MKQGKISERVLKRTILRQLHSEMRDDVLLGAGVGADCAAVAFSEDEAAVLTTDPVIWTDAVDGCCAVHANLNDLAAGGAEPVGLLLTALLPPQTEETDMRQMLSVITQECEPFGVQILGGDTQITDAVNKPVISMAAVGRANQNSLCSASFAKPGHDIVMTKWIGLEGTARIAVSCKEKLLERFPGPMVEEAEHFFQYLSIIPEAATAVKSGVRAMHDVTGGGIFDALWELAEASGVGLEIDLKKIPLRQETVEICELFDVNPYQMPSRGSLLLAASDGNRLVMDLAQAGIHAAVIGKATAGNDRVVLNEEERRFLEPPRGGMFSFREREAT